MGRFAGSIDRTYVISLFLRGHITTTTVSGLLRQHVLGKKSWIHAYLDMYCDSATHDTLSGLGQLNCDLY